MSVPDCLTMVEIAVVRAVQDGVPADLRATSSVDEPVVKAKLLQELCTDTAVNAKAPVHLIGARIIGRLDLTDANITHAIRFEDCNFADAVVFSRARAEETIELTGGKIQKIVGDDFKSDGDLVVSNTTVLDGVCLQRATIKGDVRMSHSTLGHAGGSAFVGSDLRVGGSIFLDYCVVEGEVMLSSAQISGTLDFREAQVTNPSGHSVDAADLFVGGDLLCQKLKTHGGNRLKRAVINRLCAGSHNTEPRSLDEAATIMLSASPSEVCSRQENRSEPSAVQHKRRLDIERITWNST
jgi:cytoskeletal protein CcmA (bactofilin family)